MTKKSWIILIIEALVFIALLGTVSKCSRDKIDTLEHNIDAYKDRIEYVEDRNENLIAIKESLYMNEAKMMGELEVSKAEIKDLKKKLNDDIAYIAKLESQIALKDTVFMKPDTVYVTNDNIITKHFSWNDDWTNMTASVFGNTIEDSRLSIDNLNMNVPLELGLTDNYTFWVKSENPYVNFTNIKSVVIDNSSVKEKEKRFHHGISLGFGFQYGLFGKTWDFGPQIGYSLEYSF